MKKIYTLFSIIPILIAWLFTSSFEYRIVLAQVNDERGTTTEEENATQFLINEAPTSTSGASLFKKGHNEVELMPLKSTTTAELIEATSTSTSSAPRIDSDIRDTTQSTSGENESNLKNKTATTTVGGGINQTGPNDYSGSSVSVTSQERTGGAVVLINPYNTMYRFDATTTRILLSFSGLLALLGITLIRGNLVKAPKISNILKLPYIPDGEIKEKTYGNQ